MARRGTLIAAVLLAIGIGAAVLGGVLLAGDSKATATAQAGASLPAAARRPPAPELAGEDVRTGDPLSLASLGRKPVVVAVWSSWCVACSRQARAVARFARKHEDVAVLGLDTQDTTDGAQRAYERWGWSFPSIADPDGRLAARLELRTLPTTIFLDAEHRVARRSPGPITLAELESGLALVR